MYYKISNRLTKLRPDDITLQPPPERPYPPCRRDTRCTRHGRRRSRSRPRPRDARERHRGDIPRASGTRARPRGPGDRRVRGGTRASSSTAGRRRRRRAARVEEDVVRGAPEARARLTTAAAARDVDEHRGDDAGAAARPRQGLDLDAVRGRAGAADVAGEGHGRAARLDLALALLRRLRGGGGGDGAGGRRGRVGDVGEDGAGDCDCGYGG